MFAKNCMKIMNMAWKTLKYAVKCRATKSQMWTVDTILQSTLMNANTEKTQH